MHQVRHRLARLELVDRRAGDRPLDFGAGAVHGHEHDVPRLQPHIAADVAPQEIVVEIECGHQLSEALQLHLPHVRPLREPSGGVQGGEHRAERADLVGPGLAHLTHHVNLIRPHVRDRDVEPRGSVRSALHAGVHAPEPGVQHVAQLVERQVRYEHLPDLRDEDEPLARHLERVGELHVPREDQHQRVARAELVVRWHRAGEQRQELCRAAPEHVHPEHAARHVRAAHPDQPGING